MTSSASASPERQRAPRDRTATTSRAATGPRLLLGGAARPRPREAVARTLVLFEAVQPEAGEMPVVMAAGSIGHPPARGHRPRDGGRLQPQERTSIYADKIGKPVAKPFVNIVDDGTIDRARAPSTWTTRATSGKRRTSSRGAPSRRTFTTPSARSTTACAPTGNGRRESYKHVPMPRMRSTYMLNGPHKKDEIIASVKSGILLQQLLERPGQDRRWRLHLLREERLPDRGWQADEADQGREHHRQRAQGAREDRHGGRRSRDRRGRLDLRQGRAERAGQPGDPDGARLVHHRRGRKA
jgi:predicted Zn-dependent protease